jgi:hypothetical protein
MNSICCSPLYETGRNALGLPGISELRSSSLMARSSTQISLTTADGDKVTITAGSSLRAEHITYDFLGRIQGQAVGSRVEKLQISRSTSVSAMVQGALGEEELDDIKTLLEILETAAADFLAGESQEVPEAFVKFGALGSISSFEADLSYSREASATQASSLLSAAQAAASGQSETSSALEAMRVTKPEAPKKIESFLEKLARVAARWEDEENVHRLPHRFTQLVRKLSRSLPLNEHEQALADRIQTESLNRDPHSTTTRATNFDRC